MPIKTYRRPRGPNATRILSGGTRVAGDRDQPVHRIVDGCRRAAARRCTRARPRGGRAVASVTCIFVHVGAVHLIVNVTGLWFLGRLAEEFFGPWRLTAIFAVSGIVGSFASYLASPAGISAGASGAIFGVLGALFVELTLHRKRHRAAWSRGIGAASRSSPSRRSRLVSSIR